MEIAKMFPVSGIIFERKARIYSTKNSNFPAVAASAIRCHRRSQSREENRVAVRNILACFRAFQKGYGEVRRYEGEQKFLHRGLGPCCLNARASETQDSLQTAEEVREQLESLHGEAEQVRGRANSARARFIRLTDAVEQLRQRAALDVRTGNEASARFLLIEKQKVMKALEAARQRAELLEQLGAKLNVAISRKETQLIGALSCARVDLDRETSEETTVRVVSPREEGEDASRALDTDESKHFDDASLTVTEGLGKETSPVSTTSEHLFVDDAEGAGASPQDANIPEYEQEKTGLDSAYMEDSTSIVKQLVVPTMDMDDNTPLIKPQGLRTETNPVSTDKLYLSLDGADAVVTSPQDANRKECGQESKGVASAYNEDSTSSVEQLIVPSVDLDDYAASIKLQSLGTETTPASTNQENVSLDDAEAASKSPNRHECGQENRGLGNAYNEDSTSSGEKLIVPAVDTEANNGSSSMDRRPLGSAGISRKSELSLSQDLAESEILGKASDNDFNLEHPEKAGQSWMEDKDSDTAISNGITKLRAREETLAQLEENAMSRFNTVVQNIVNGESGVDDIIDTQHATKSEEIQDVARALDVQVGSMERETWATRGVAYDAFMQKLDELFEQAEFQLLSFLKVGEVGGGDEDQIKMRVETLSKLLEQLRSMRAR